MSGKFRWFLLGACAFVVLMGGGDAITLLAAGPQAQHAPSELALGPQLSTKPSAAARTLPLRRVLPDGELASGKARQQ